jgi:hypothetical protein
MMVPQIPCADQQPVSQRALQLKPAVPQLTPKVCAAGQAAPYVEHPIIRVVAGVELRLCRHLDHLDQRTMQRPQLLLPQRCHQLLWVEAGVVQHFICHPVADASSKGLQQHDWLMHAMGTG